MPVTDLVAYNDERRLATFLRKAEDIVHRTVFLYSGHCDNALMGMSAAHEIEFAPVAFHNGYAEIPCS